MRSLCIYTHNDIEYLCQCIEFSNMHQQQESEPVSTIYLISQNILIHIMS